MQDGRDAFAGTSPLAGAPSSVVRRWRRRLADEREEAKVYRDLATRRTGTEREILLELAEAEERHAAHWARLLGDELGRTRRGDVRIHEEVVRGLATRGRLGCRARFA